MKTKKITHDIGCNNCDKPATVNICNEWHLYNILPDGDYEETGKIWSGDDSIDLCDKCYENGNY